MKRTKKQGHTRRLHPCNSDVQRDAEPKLLKALGHKIGYDLQSREIRLNPKSSIQIDGFSSTGRVMCEAYAHIGDLRGSQPDKLASDILKLELAESRLGGRWRKILLFADGKACRLLMGYSWLAEACKLKHIEIEIAECSANVKRIIAQTQTRQKMISQRQVAVKATAKKNL